MHKLLGVALMGALFIPAVSSAATVADLEAQIQALMQQLQALQAQLQILQGGTAWCHTFNTNMGMGYDGSELSALLSAFDRENLGYSGIHGTTYYDELVASAVTGFQEKYKDEILTPNGLKYGTGYVGRATRAKLNKLYGCGPDNIHPIVKPSITVTVLSPNGGEVWHPGETHRISWSSSGVSAVKIYIYDSNVYGSGSTNYITKDNASIPASQGYYDWTIPSLNQLPSPGGNGSTNYRIRIDNAYWDSSASALPSPIDSSDAPFTITAASATAQAPTITAINPKSTTVGTTVYVYGMNFDQTTFVAWDGTYGQTITPALFSATTLSFIVPSNASIGAHTIQVNDKASSFPLSNSFTLNVTAVPSITVLSPNGGEVWQESPQVTDTLSGYESYRHDIKWTGAPDDYNVVNAYLEQLVNGQYITIGRIPPFAYGSIAWVTGVVSPASCSGLNGVDQNGCYNKSKMFVVAPGQYYVRLVNTQTGVWGRSDAPFTIAAASQRTSIDFSAGIWEMPAQATANQDFTIDVSIQNNSHTPVSASAGVTATLNIYDANGNRVYSVGSAVNDPAFFAGTTNLAKVHFSSTLFNPSTNLTLLRFPAGTYKVVASVIAGNNDDPVPSNDTITVPLLVVAAPAVSPNSPLYEWKLDDGRGMLAKQSSLAPNNLDGSVVGNASWTPAGIINGALQFDGSTYVSIPDDPSLRLTGDVTLSAWVYRDPATSNTDWVRIAGKGDSNNRNYGLWYYGYTGEVLFQIYGDRGPEQTGTSWGTVANKLTLDPGRWYLVTGVRQGSVASLYLNSTLVASHDFATTPLISSDAFIIGYAGYSNKHIGKIDDVRIYNRALSQSEITALAAPLAAIPKGSMALSLSSASAPSRQVTMGSTNVNLGAFRFIDTANVEAMKIPAVSFILQKGSGVNVPSFTNVKLYQNGTLIGGPISVGSSTTPNGSWVLTFNFVPSATPVVPQNGSLDLGVYADVMTYASGGAQSGAVYSLLLAPNNVTAVGQASGSVIPVAAPAGGPGSNPITVLRTKLTVSAASLGPVNARARAAIDDIANITFTADPAYDATIKYVNLTITGSVSPFTAELIDPAIGADWGNALNPSTCTPQNGTAVCSFGLPSPPIIPAGSSKTVKLRINSTGFSGSQLSASIASATDVNWGDGTTSGLGLEPASIPILITNISYSGGVGANQGNVQVGSAAGDDQRTQQLANVLDILSQALQQLLGGAAH